MSIDIDAVLATHADRDHTQPRRLTEAVMSRLGMRTGEALATNRDHKMISIPVRNRLAGLAGKRAGELGVSRSAYIRRVVAEDVARAYDLDADELSQTPGTVGHDPSRQPGARIKKKPT